MKETTKLGASASHKKRLRKLANKAEKLSRLYVDLRDKSCRCGCGQTKGLDWAHAITREREIIKYHPDNTFNLFHECHLKIDHSGKQKEFFSGLIGEERYEELKLLSFQPFKPTEEFYNNVIADLTERINQLI